MKKSYFSLIYLCLFLNNFLNAQNFEGGLFIGASTYNGDVDVTPRNFLPQMREAVGVFGRYSLNNTWSVRANMFYGHLYGDEKKYPSSDYRGQRGFSFNTTLTEFSLQAEWSFLNFDSDFSLDKENPFISFYGFGGVGGLNFNPKTDFNEPNRFFDNVSADKNERFAKTVFVIPFGMGVKINITDPLSIGLEGGIRKTFTDYVDGVSKVLNSKSKDYYMFSGITLTYHFQQQGGWLGNGLNQRRRRSGCPTF